MSEPATNDPERTPADEQIRIGELTAHVARLLDENLPLDPACEECAELLLRLIPTP